MKDQQLSSFPQEIKAYLEQSLNDPEAKIFVKRTSLGWVHLRIISKKFQEKTEFEREQIIGELLEKKPPTLSLSDYPFASYDLLTPEEASTIPDEPIVQIPLWSEILMAPEPEQRVILEDEKTNEKRPLVVTFYSFKGGVGRTTALGIIARMLATDGYRVVMIDFDLEAPGLSFLFPSSSPPSFGVLDYLHQRYLTPDQPVPEISDCIQQIELASRGDLYLIPSGEYHDESYVHRLADLDIRLFYRRENNPITQMMQDIKTHLDPDIILIDARTGFTEIGAVALLDLADLGIICFSPTEQSFAGLQWVIRAAKKQYYYRGIPDLRFLLTPIPQVETNQKEEWIGRAEEWITSVWEVPADLSVRELHTDIPYNPAITTIRDLLKETLPGILDVYRPIAEAISSVLPPSNAATLTKNVSEETRSQVLRELKFLSATAQEMSAEEIPRVFQKTGDFPKFLHHQTWLVRGAKGTGKSLLFRLFVERPEDAKHLASSEANLNSVTFIPGHGRSELFPTLLGSGDIESYQRQVDDSGKWSRFWPLYALLQICAAKPEITALENIGTDSQLMDLIHSQNPQHQQIVAWIIQRGSEPFAESQVGDALSGIDRWLNERGEKVWLFYDELDITFQSEDIRIEALNSLLVWWIEYAASFRSIVPKILLREDIWKNLTFSNKGHFTGRTVLLQWDEADLWRLVLRQVLLQSETLKELVLRQYAVTRESLDKIELNRLRASLFPLWGERMGRGKKAYTYNWIRNRITDANNNLFPRSMLALLQKAVEIERSEHSSYDAILRPRTLIKSLPFVSEQRVDEVREEYPELTRYLDALRGARSPIEEERLLEIWFRYIGEEGKTLKEVFLEERWKDIIERMKQAGIFQVYLRDHFAEFSPRYAVAELYLYGLGMTRKGQQ